MNHDSSSSRSHRATGSPSRTPHRGRPARTHRSGRATGSTGNLRAGSAHAASIHHRSGTSRAASPAHAGREPSEPLAAAAADEPGEPPGTGPRPSRSSADSQSSSGSSSHSTGVVHVLVANRQTALVIDEDRLAEAVRRVLQGEGRSPAEISLAVVDNAEIHRLNAQFLRHDYPTDALSFVLDEGPSGLEGEIIVSAEMAAQQAGRYGLQPGDELLLYVIHAALHLAGFDDLEPSAEPVMRARERHYLAGWGLTPGQAEPPEDGSEDPSAAPRRGDARTNSGGPQA